MGSPINTKNLIGFIAVASLTVPCAAIAIDAGPYIGAEGGAVFQANQYIDNGDAHVGLNKFKAGWLGGLVAGYGFDNGFRPEFAVEFRRAQARKTNVFGVGSFTDTGGFENATTGMLNFWYDVKTSTGLFSKLHPYYGFGVGISSLEFQNVGAPVIGRISDHNNNQMLFAYQGGAGIGYDVTKRLSASLDWRYLILDRAGFTDTQGNNNVTARYRANEVFAGLRYSFGIPPKQVAYTAPVEQAYVPPPPPPPAAGPCADTDGDGVCDAVDKCPGTPKGFKVDADGCIIEQKIILRSVNFEFNKDKLTAPAQASLNEVGAALVGQPSLRVEIAGYTDSVGSAAYNLNLSKKRAAAVKAYLVSKGVSASNLVSQGYGKAAPIASNATEEGRAENRRVEFSVLSKPATASVVTKGSTEASKSAAEGDPVGKKPVKKARKK